jgi:hypothetical protein
VFNKLKMFVISTVADDVRDSAAYLVAYTPSGSYVLYTPTASSARHVASSLESLLVIVDDFFVEPKPTLTVRSIKEAEAAQIIGGRATQGVNAYYGLVFSALGRRSEDTSHLRRRLDILLLTRYKRLTGQAPRNELTSNYRGGQLTQIDYKRLKLRIGVLTEAIKNDGRYDVLSALQDVLAVTSRAYVRQLITRLNNSLSLSRGNFVLAYCGHVAFEDDCGEVMCSHTAEIWCEDCTNDCAVYVEDTEQLTDQRYAYEHSTGDYYSYEEAEDAQDTVENCSLVMRYHTSILAELDPVTTLVSSAYGDFTMGVELEMTSGRGGVTDAVEDVRRALGHEYCIIKADSSLPDNGFEVVTMPAPLTEHISRVSSWNINPEYRAWEAQCCGVHVHIDAKAFSKLTLGKFIIFINKADNEKLITSIAGRHPNTNSNAAGYCRSEAQSTLGSPTKAIKGKSDAPGRYHMVNLCNIKQSSCERLGLDSRNFNGKYDTVELRIFRASLRKERLLSQIEFTHAAVIFSRAASYRDLNEATFLKWLATAQHLYPNLAAWFSIRKVKENPRSKAVAVQQDENDLTLNDLT